MTRQVDCGGVLIGGGAPVSIQSMTNTRTEDVDRTVEQILALEQAGCQIVRCAVPCVQAAEAIASIKKRIHIPLVADIHFDYRLAIAAIENGADKIRVNPGNIGDRKRLEAVVAKAGERGVPIRIGVNGGSLEKDLLSRFGGPSAEALAESALRNEALVRAMGFDSIVMSIKSSDVQTNLEAHRILAARTDCPLHIGITEAGIGQRAVIKSAVGIGSLLLEGIGDTIRVSITGEPVQEIDVARSILAATGRLPGAINVVSCPTCGRCKTDLARLASRITQATQELEAAPTHPAAPLQDQPSHTTASAPDQPAHTPAPLQDRPSHPPATTAAPHQDQPSHTIAPTPDQPSHTAAPLHDQPSHTPAPTPDPLSHTIAPTPHPPVLTVAVMGCAVNGPGEASHADVGVACGEQKAVLFRNGQIIRSLGAEEIIPALLAEINHLRNRSS